MSEGVCIRCGSPLDGRPMIVHDDKSWECGRLADCYAKVFETLMPVMPAIQPNQSYMLRWNPDEQKVEVTIVDRDI